MGHEELTTNPGPSYPKWATSSSLQALVTLWKKFVPQPSSIATVWISTPNHETM
jgi:hypothetical protein